MNLKQQADKIREQQRLAKQLVDEQAKQRARAIDEAYDRIRRRREND